MKVSRFHRKVIEHGIKPVLKGPGLRGAMFWSPEDIDRLREAEAEAGAETEAVS